MQGLKNRLAIFKMLQRLTMWLLLLIILTSCAMPTLHVERCVINIDNNACICTQYEATADHTGNTSDAVIHDLYYCEKMIGFRPDQYVIFRNWVGDVIRWANRMKKK